MTKQVCEGCPLAAICGTAEEIVTTNNHKSADQALGGIALTRAALEGVVSRTNCTGGHLNQNGQLGCPLEGAAMMARAMGGMAWPPNAYEIPLGDLAQTQPTAPSNTGQYL